MSKESIHVAYIRALLRAERRHDDRVDDLFDTVVERYGTAPLDPDYDPEFDLDAEEVSALAGQEVNEREAIFVQHAQPAEFAASLTARLSFIEETAALIRQYIDSLPESDVLLVADNTVGGIAEVAATLFAKADELMRFATVQEFGPNESDRELN